MKIAILTLPLHTNFGGILQAYALQTVLEDMGHEVEVLQRKFPIPPDSYLMPLIYAKRILKKLLKDRRQSIFLEKKKKKEFKLISQKTQAFIDKYIHTRVIDSLSEIKPSDYDAIVVGSDQIWRKPYFKYFWKKPIKDAFLDFTKNWPIKRLSYAASFGTDNLSEYNIKDIDDCSKAIQSFNGVSVREVSGIRICEKDLHKEAIHVLDPTMLLSRERYEKLIEAKNPPASKGDILCYFLDPNKFKDQITKDVERELGLKSFNSSVNIENTSLSAEERIQAAVESWLKGFQAAKFVLTDSFHACVFSIIFGKPFIVIGNHKRGMARFQSLLSTFSLEDRIINEGDTLEIKKLTQQRQTADPSLLKELSIDFLKKALG